MKFAKKKTSSIDGKNGARKKSNSPSPYGPLG